MFCRDIQYKVENASVLDEVAKKAFISLHSEPYIEPPLLTFDQKRFKWFKRYMRKQLKSEKKGEVEALRNEIEIVLLIAFQWLMLI